MLKERELRELKNGNGNEKKENRVGVNVKICSRKPVFLAFALFFSFFFFTGISQAWWDTSWSYRKNITVTELSGNSLTDYPVVYWFEHEGNANSDCSDIRLLDEAENLVPFGLRNCNSTHVELVNKWNLSASSSKNYTVYYGNPSATFNNSPWNEIRYNFWDDFEDGDISDWTTSGTVNVTGGAMWVVDVNSYATKGIGFTPSPNASYEVDVYYEAGGVNTIEFKLRDAGTELTSTTDNYPTNGFWGYSTADGWIDTGLADSSDVWYHFKYSVDSTNDVFIIDIDSYKNYSAFRNAGDFNELFFISKLNGEVLRVDNVSIRHLTDPEPTITLGSEEAVPGQQPPKITIFSPKNTTYLANWILLNFTVTDDIDLNVTCWRNFDGTEILIGDVMNDTYNYTNITNINEGEHYMNVTCEDDVPKITTEIVYFTIIYYNITNEFYYTEIYETNLTAFQININTASNIDDLNAKIEWNGTNYTVIKEKSGLNYKFNFTKTIDLLETNSTKINFRWIYYSGSDERNYTQHEQTLYYAYWIESITGNANDFLEGDTFILDVNVMDLLILADKYVNVTFDGIEYPTTLTNGLYRYTNQTEMVTSGNNDTRNYYANLTITFNGITKIRGSIEDFIVVHKLGLDDCSSYGTKTLNITLNDETNRTLITGNVDVTFSALNGNVNRSYPFGFNNIQYQELCIYPSWGSFRVDAQIQYDATNFQPRTYWIWNATFSNTTQNLDLYLLETNKATKITFTVVDQAGTEQVGVLMKIQRYYLDTNSYITVAIGKTDSNGETLSYLVANDVYYKFIFEKDGEVLDIKPAMLITSTSIVFTLAGEKLIQNFQYLLNTAASCTFTESTGYLTCTVSDTTGLMKKGCLEVTRRGVLQDILECKKCEESSSFTIGCNLGNTTGKTYHYTLYGYFSEPLTFISDYIETISVPVYGAEGLLLGTVLIGTTAFAGIWNPFVAIILTLTALGLTIVFNLVALKLFAFMSLLIVAVIIIFKGR